MANFWSTLFGKSPGVKQQTFQQYSPEQMQAFNQLFQGLMGGTGAFSDLFGEFNPEHTANVFERGVAEPAMRNFQQRIQPGIMQAFADQGASSGLSNSLASAGQDLQRDLSGQLELFMNQARLQNMQNRMGGLQGLLGAQPYQRFYPQQGQAGIIPSFLGSAGQGIGTGFGLGAANPLLKMLGLG